jgi:hypothetical protein
MDASCSACLTTTRRSDSESENRLDDEYRPREEAIAVIDVGDKVPRGAMTRAATEAVLSRAFGTVDCSL